MGCPPWLWQLDSSLDRFVANERFVAVEGGRESIRTRPLTDETRRQCPSRRPCLRPSNGSTARRASLNPTAAQLDHRTPTGNQAA